MFIKISIWTNKKELQKKTHHRVINSSTGAVIEDDGIKFEMAIVIGTFVEIVDDEDETDVDDNSVLLTFNESCISLRNCVIFCVKFSLFDSVNVRSIPVIKLSNAVDKIACLAWVWPYNNCCLISVKNLFSFNNIRPRRGFDIA